MINLFKMMISQINGHFRLVALATTLALAVGAIGSSALTASNTVPNSVAGDGAGAVSGFTVSGKSFVLNTTDPSKIDSVTFNMTPTTATTVKAQFVTAGSFYNCSNVAGSVSCATTSPQLTVSAANTLRVLATE